MPTISSTCITQPLQFRVVDPLEDAIGIQRVITTWCVVVQVTQFDGAFDDTLFQFRRVALHLLIQA